MADDPLAAGAAPFATAPLADAPRATGLLARAGWLWWAVTGAALGLGIVSILTIGVLFLVLGVGLGLAGILTERLRTRSAALALVGAAAAPLVLAWLNRDGPGTACSSSGSGTSCVDEWSPWPFVAAAVVLVAAGLLLARRPGRQPSA